MLNPGIPSTSKGSRILGFKESSEIKIIESLRLKKPLTPGILGPLNPFFGRRNRWEYSHEKKF